MNPAPPVTRQCAIENVPAGLKEGRTVCAATIYTVVGGPTHRGHGAEVAGRGKNVAGQSGSINSVADSSENGTGTEQLRANGWPDMPSAAAPWGFTQCPHGHHPASLDLGTGSHQNFPRIVPAGPVESRPAKARAAMILAGMARGRKGQAKVPSGPSVSRLCPSDRHGRPAASRGIHHRGTLESRGSAPGCSLSTSPPEFGSHSH